MGPRRIYRGRTVAGAPAAPGGGGSASAGRKFRPRAIIFDFDGVLAETESLHYECFRKVLGEEGIELPAAKLNLRYLGINDRAGFSKAFEEAGRLLGPDLCRDLVERKSRCYRDRLGELRIYPGVAKLLEDLAGLLPLGIGSGGIAAEIEAVLRAHGIRDLFEAIVSADDVAASKPAPDCFLRTLEELRARAPRLQGRLSPEECLVVEDSSYGIQAARSASMRCLAVAHTFPPEALAGADWIASRLGDLAAEDLLEIDG